MSFPKQGGPAVLSSPGCANPPIPSPYTQVGASYLRYGVNIGPGGCAAGAVITLIETIVGAAGTPFMQTVGSLGNTLGPPVTANFTLR